MDTTRWASNAVALSVVLIVGCILGGCDSTEAGDALFADAFEETNCLGKWIVGGRQQEGINTANCEERNGSVMGHLFKFSFTEITLAPDLDPFLFSSSLVFNFDMEVRVSSTGGAPSNFYGSSGVRFDFYDAEGTVLGSVFYIAATTSFPFQDAADDPTRGAVQIAAGSLRSHSLTAEEILSHVDIAEDAIATVRMSFRAYSSTRPNPRVEAELWVDNVRVVRS
ncbi:MAG: hypothetical protein GVY12_15215 [Bacteroidetes bacterium]|jgi:hypothetical protein|nr:hypothetical protein [Bacteroidota bacterium]